MNKDLSIYIEFKFKIQGSGLNVMETKDERLKSGNCALIFHLSLLTPYFFSSMSFWMA